VWGKPKAEVSAFVCIDMDKDLYPIYDIENDFENSLFNLNDDGIPIERFWGLETNFEKDEEGNITDPYGTPLKAIPAKKLLKFIEKNRKALLQERTMYTDNGKQTYIPYFDEERIQCLIKMLKALKEHSVVLYWS